MRSLLIVPANERQLAEAFKSGADALIVDLASTPPDERAGARDAAARWLKDRRVGGPALLVGVHALDSGETDADLDALMAGAPDAILLAGSLGAPSVQALSAKLALREAEFGLDDGVTRIVAVVDTAHALFNMGSYRGSSARLAGLAWSAGPLRRDIGAEAERDRHGALLGPFRLARELTLIAATAARVVAIDAPFPDVRDLEGLRAEALAARRDGFAGKLAVDAAQVGILNEVFARANAAR